MIPSLMMDWGPELRPWILALTLGALLPGALVLAAELLGVPARRRTRAGGRLVPAGDRIASPAHAWMPVETAALSPRRDRRSVRRHAQRRPPTP